MASSTTTSGLLGKTIRVAATTTTLAAILVLPGEDILPSRYYALNPPFFSGYQWEIKETYAQRPKEQLVVIGEFQIIQEFVTKIVTQSKDLDPRYDQLISEHFWELV